MAKTAADVRQILDLLESVAADPRVSGGWRVDALVGSQTRVHRDVDLAVRAEALEDAPVTLGQHDFEVAIDWLPVRRRRGLAVGTMRGDACCSRLNVDRCGEVGVR